MSIHKLPQVQIETKGVTYSEIQDFFNACVVLGAKPYEAVDEDFLPTDYKYIGVDKDNYCTGYDAKNYSYVSIDEDGETYMGDYHCGVKTSLTFKDALDYLASWVIDNTVVCTEQEPAAVSAAKLILGVTKSGAGIKVTKEEFVPELNNLSLLVSEVREEGISLNINHEELLVRVDSGMDICIMNEDILIKTIQFLKSKRSLEESIEASK